jgi:integrase
MNIESENVLNKIKLAKRFKRLHLKNNDFSFRNISSSLHALSLKVRPDVWRQYRNSVSFYAQKEGQEKMSEDIKNLFNPTTIKYDDPRIIGYEEVTALIGMQPKKQNRCTKVIEKDHQKILNYITKNPDRAVLGAIYLAYFTGMRPAEMLNIELIPEQNAIYIHTAKETEDGERGLSRTLLFSEMEYKLIEKSFDAVISEKQRQRAGKFCDPERAMKRIQNRLAKITESIFPRRKHQITLYSYRHQMGSDLKASGNDPISIAAIMGHQSVNSIDVYGNARSAWRQPSMQVSEDSKAAVRVKEKRTLDQIFPKGDKAEDHPL